MKRGFLCFLIVMIFLPTLSKSQTIAWTKIYGASGEDFGVKIIGSPNNGYLFLGNSQYQEHDSFYLLKIDFSGLKVWDKFYSKQNGMTPTDIVSTFDGGYAICGFVGEYGVSTYILKTDSLGDSLWAKSFSNPNPLYGTKAEKIIQTLDTSLIVIGHFSGQGGGQGFILKLSNEGDSLDILTKNNHVTFKDIILLDDGLFVLGSQSDYNILHSLYATFINSSFDFEEEKYFGGDDSTYATTCSMLSDSTIIIGGERTRYHPLCSNNAVMVWQTNKYGDSLWSSIIGDSLNRECDKIEGTNDSGFITCVDAFPVCSTTSGLGPDPLIQYEGNGSSVIVKYNAQFSEQWSIELDTNIQYIKINSVQETYDGDYIIGGSIYNKLFTEVEMYVAKIVIPVGVEEYDFDNLPFDFILSQNYPNPFNPTTTIEFNLPTKSMVTVNIYNLLGQQVQQLVNQEYSAGNYKVTWDGKTFGGVQTSNGIYFYRLETDDFVETKKMLLLK